MGTRKKPSPPKSKPPKLSKPTSPPLSKASSSKPTARPRAGADGARAGWIRMGALSRESGVPASTIKHYLREGLLPEASVSTVRNSALYDPALVARLVEIKDLQQTHFLPLWRIKEVLQGKADPRVATVSAAVDRVIAEDGHRSATRASLLRQGLTADDLDALVRAGLVPADEALSGDDLALAETVLRARTTGLTEHLPVAEIVARYHDNVRRLVEDEIAIFRDTILSGAGERLAQSTVEAMKVSERLVVLLRRRLLLPTFERAAAAPVSPARRAGG